MYYNNQQQPNSADTCQPAAQLNWLFYWPSNIILLGNIVPFDMVIILLFFVKLL